MSVKATNIKDSNKEIWINPAGGYGNILILSGVLKQCFDKDPQQKYCLVRRAIFTELLDGHPAIRKVGHPPKDAFVITTDYWLKENPGTENKRPYQILARLFRLPTPATEQLYLPGMNDEDKLLQDFIPNNGRKIAVIAPSSAAPRKTMKPLIWQEVVETLTNRGIMVIQVGLKDEIYIKGTYSLLGLTTVRQLISVLKRCEIVIGVHNFIMHAAYLVGKPALIIWGPTDSKVYGYAGHNHIQCPTHHCEFRNSCLEPELTANLKSPCPLKDKHCMNLVSADAIIESSINLLSVK